MDEEQLSVEEMKERKIMKLLLKVKNGTPPQRKSALRQLTDKARDFGAGPLFNQILPLLMSPTLEDQERHLLVKVSLPPTHHSHLLNYNDIFLRLLRQHHAPNLPASQSSSTPGVLFRRGIRQTWRILRDLVDWPCGIFCLDPSAELCISAHVFSWRHQDSNLFHV